MKCLIPECQESLVVFANAILRAASLDIPNEVIKIAYVHADNTWYVVRGYMLLCNSSLQLCETHMDAVKAKLNANPDGFFQEYRKQ